jgi:hypothetical protein
MTNELIIKDRNENILFKTAGKRLILNFNKCEIQRISGKMFLSLPVK